VCLTSRDKFAAGFGSLWLTFWTVACYFLAVTVYKKWKAVRGGGWMKLLGLWAPPCLPCPFLWGIDRGASLLTSAVSVPAAATLAAMAFLNALFYHLLKAPTLSAARSWTRWRASSSTWGWRKKSASTSSIPRKRRRRSSKNTCLRPGPGCGECLSEQFAEVLAKAGDRDPALLSHLVCGSSLRTASHTSRFTDSLGSSFCQRHLVILIPPGFVLGSGGGGFSGGGGGGGGGSGW